MVRRNWEFGDDSEESVDDEVYEEEADGVEWEPGRSPYRDKRTPVDRKKAPRNRRQTNVIRLKEKVRGLDPSWGTYKRVNGWRHQDILIPSPKLCPLQHFTRSGPPSDNQAQ